jgi:excisionase family DNA binding protein
VPVKEAAARLGLSESDVRRRIKAGTLPAERFDRPQGTYYRVIFESPTDALTSADEASTARQNQPPRILTRQLPARTGPQVSTRW